MELATAVALAMAIGLNLYVILGGADFGGGVWDLFATGPRKEAQQALVAHAIGPVWEANHVWLILVVVLLFACFPPAFAAYMIALHVPITLGLIGIVLRGSAFAFRAYGAIESREQRRWGRVFAAASIFTPFMLGVCIGAVASGRASVENGLPVNGFVGSWLGPFPLAVGGFTLAVFSLLAAVFLTLETDDPALREDFRRRALAAAVAAGAAAAMALATARLDAPPVWRDLTSGTRAALFHLVTGAFAVGAIAALVARRYHLARVLVPVQVSLILWGWLANQYPYLVVPTLTIEEAAAPTRTLRLVLVALAAGAVVLFPSFAYLYATFEKFRGRT
jgi:cytochrome d ubiquinol oxidase subunit II